MSVFKLINETKAKGKVKKIFNDIKKTRNIKKIPNFWRAIANNPDTLERTWNNLKQIIDNLLLVNLFTVIFFAIFFIFAIIMQLNGIFIFINFIQIVWNPLVVPLITILIFGALVNGINSWWRRKLLSQEEDI